VLHRTPIKPVDWFTQSETFPSHSHIALPMVHAVGLNHMINEPSHWCYIAGIATPQSHHIIIDPILDFSEADVPN
jgi:hypothetical protein